MSSFSRISKRFIEEEDEASLDKLKHHSLNISKIFIEPSSPCIEIKSNSSKWKFRSARSIRYKPLDTSVKPSPLCLANESKFSSKLKLLTLSKTKKNESTCEYEESLFINDNEKEKKTESYSKISILTILENKGSL